MTPTVPHSVPEKLNAVREVFRLRRLARDEHRLHGFYLEHNLFVEAEQTRTEMLDHLRTACRLWRTALDLAV
ncbi:MAG: hypothetical protein ACK501_16220 [Planctomycetota bacterium]|jgi:hypothetical protein